MTDSPVQIKFGTLAPPINGSSNFSDNFDDGNDAGWGRYGENFSNVSGRYQILNAPANGNASSKALAGDDTWTSGTLEADVNLSSAGNAGFMFRTANAGFGDYESVVSSLTIPAGTVSTQIKAGSWSSSAHAARSR